VSDACIILDIIMLLLLLGMIVAVSKYERGAFIISRQLAVGSWHSAVDSWGSKAGYGAVHAGAGWWRRRIMGGTRAVDWQGRM